MRNQCNCLSATLVDAETHAYMHQYAHESMILLDYYLLGIATSIACHATQVV